MSEHDDDLAALLTTAGVEISTDGLAWVEDMLLDEERPIQAWPIGGLLLATNERLLRFLFERTRKGTRLTFCDSLFLKDIVRVVARFDNTVGELSFLTAGQHESVVLSATSDDIETVTDAWRGIHRLALAAKRRA